MGEGKVTRLLDSPAPRRSEANASRCLEEPFGAFSSGLKLALEGCKGSRIGFWPSANDEVDGRDPLQDVQADDFPESSLQLIPLHDRVAMLGNDEAYAGMMQKGSDDSELEKLGPNSLPFT
jgi:hypothetical protein